MKQRADTLIFKYRGWEVVVGNGFKYMARSPISNAYFPSNDSQEQVKKTIDRILDGP